MFWPVWLAACCLPPPLLGVVAGQGTLVGQPQKCPKVELPRLDRLSKNLK